jgi:3-isopropylmalate/(R)-2-methylmalate dehydratase large subunit
MAKPRTLYDKIWEDHLVDEQPDGTCLIYIDRHLVHEVTSPQAFEGLRLSGRKVRRPERLCAWSTTMCRPPIATCPTRSGKRGADRLSRRERQAVRARIFQRVRQAPGHRPHHRPEQGFTLPGTTLVCGDSHTATHGAFGALAYGIGTSEVEHVLATQTLIQSKSKNMRAVVDGKLPEGVTAKDIILAIIGEIGTAGGTGYALEYAGEAIRLAVHGRPHDGLQHVGRGRRQGRLHRPDEKAFAYAQGSAALAKGKLWDEACAMGHAALGRGRAVRSLRSG